MALVAEEGFEEEEEEEKEEEEEEEEATLSSKSGGSMGMVGFYFPGNGGGEFRAK